MLLGKLAAVSLVKGMDTQSFLDILPVGIPRAPVDPSDD